MADNRITKLMEKLGCSAEEAIEILTEDAEIDKMTVKEAYSDLTDEQRKAVKSATITGSKKKVAVKRERKIDPDKLLIMNALDNFLYNLDYNLQITNRQNENEISFSMGENNFTLKLIKHRPKK